KQNIAKYRQELSTHDQEVRRVGSEVLALKFKDVRDKFEDVIVRTDVGNVDVAWSKREDTDDDLKRLNLARARDLKQLRDEFRFILDETTTTPAQPKLKEPATAPGPEGQSPDKGGPTDTRVKPAGDQTKDTNKVVKPDGDQPKTAPKTAPKT